MSVKFEKSPYLASIKDNENLNDEKKIFNYAKEHPQFKYGEVTYQKFTEKYLSDGWFGRKIIALPAAVCSGVVKTICHLAKAIFKGIPKAFSDKGNYLKAQIFYVTRDFQETFGRLVSLFHDKYGQYHIQESQFQKSCYDCFATNTTLNTSSSNSSGESWFYMRSSTVKYGVMVDDKAKETSLSDYKEKTVEERNKLVQRFNLDQASSQLAQSGTSLDEFVDQADNEMLKDLTLEDVIIPFQHSKLKFALLNEEKFNALTIKDLEEGINNDQFHFIKKRLEKLSENEENSDQQKDIEDYDNIKDIPLKDLPEINAGDIAKHKGNIPAIAFTFFINDQLQDLKLSNLQETQNKALFNFLDEVEVEVKERLALFDDLDVVDATHKGLLTGNVLKFLSNEHVKGLKLPQLSKEQTEVIFSWKDNSDQDRQRFKAFKPEDVQYAIECGILLRTYQLKLLSDEQLKGIQLSKLSKETIKNMFPWSEDNTSDRKRFSNLNEAEVKSAL